MFLLDRMLIGTIRFVLDKVSAAAENEIGNADGLRERLLEAQMRQELGEIDEKEFAAIEKNVLAALRALKERQEEEAGEEGLSLASGATVVGASAEIAGDIHEEDVPSGEGFDHPEVEESRTPPGSKRSSKKSSRKNAAQSLPKNPARSRTRPISGRVLADGGVPDDLPALDSASSTTDMMPRGAGTPRRPPGGTSDAPDTMPRGAGTPKTGPSRGTRSKPAKKR